nr:reverse transcriptase domain-containing protein [Tanacetum cinerariifolium]
MLERFAGNEYYCFLDGFSGYFQIPIDPHNQVKTTFTCPYGTFAYRRMPFGLCNAPGSFQRCMLAIFHDMVEKTMEVFMDDFSVFGNSFEDCLSRLDKMLQRCEDTNLSLNWEKSYFMVKEGIVLGHKISKNGIEVDRAKVDVIAKLPHPTTVKEPGYIENYNSYPYDSLSFPQQELCCEDCESCVENLVPNPSESEEENGCDVHACFTTFSNVLFDAEYEFDSVDDQSCSDEDVLEKIFSNPLFEEEINSMRIDPHHFNAESDLIKSLLNCDSSIFSSSSKIDSLLDEFAGELPFLKSIPPGIDKTDCYYENDIRLIERLLYDNSSPCLPEEFVSDNSDANIEYFSPSPILIEDSDYLMEEMDLSCTPDDPMTPSIKDDDDDSKRDILIHEELFDNYSLSLPVIKSFYFDIPSFSRPPTKPPDVVQYSRKLEDSCQRILSSKSSFPQLQLGIMKIEILSFLGAYFIALREDTQHLSMGDF